MGFINHRFFAENDPFLAKLRGDLRFEALMERARAKQREIEAEEDPVAEPAVLYEVANHVATLTLNRPDNRNSMTADLLSGLADAVAEGWRWNWRLFLDMSSLDSIRNDPRFITQKEILEADMAVQLESYRASQADP